MNAEILTWQRIVEPGRAVHSARLDARELLSKPLHCHDFYECFLVEQGHIMHLSDCAEAERLTPGMLVFMRPEHAHGLRCRGKSRLCNTALSNDIVEAFLVRHRATLPPGLWSVGQPPLVVQLVPSQVDELQAVLSQVAGSDATVLDGEWYLCSLARILASQEVPVPVSLPSWFRDALSRMREPDNLRLGHEQLVRLCGCSTEHVARICRRYLDTTPTAWLLKLRLRNACRLLRTTQLSITDVALECGIDNLSYFHRCFKRVHGGTPRQYRHDHHTGIFGT
jgi:AraC family cel operon transcriptional repressor